MSEKLINGKEKKEAEWSNERRGKQRKGGYMQKVGG